MKICIPIMAGEGVGALICDHFGSAPQFVIYDPEMQNYETIGNPKAEHEHGQCRPLELLAGRSVLAVICKGMGRNAMAAIEQSGIKVFITSGGTVGEAVAEFLAGRLTKPDLEAACRGHGHH